MIATDITPTLERIGDTYTTWTEEDYPIRIAAALRVSGLTASVANIVTVYECLTGEWEAA